MTIIAIDPGRSGGIATLTTPEDRSQINTLAVEKMPETLGDLVTALDRVGDIHTETVVYVEHVQGYAGQNRPGAHMFALGESFGAIQGILAAYGVRTVLVRPQKWQKYFSLGTRSACISDNEWKNKLKAEAQRRFPKINVTLATADALLLLEYAYRQEIARN